MGGASGAGPPGGPAAADREGAKGGVDQSPDC